MLPSPQLFAPPQLVKLKHTPWSPGLPAGKPDPGSSSQFPESHVASYGHAPPSAIANTENLKPDNKKYIIKTKVIIKTTLLISARLLYNIEETLSYCLLHDLDILS